MKVVFCSDPFNSNKPDEAYLAEAEAAQRLGAECILIDHDALTIEQNPSKALRRIKPSSSPSLAIYRGWMMRPVEYEQLYEGLLSQGIRLINDPVAYRHCHYLPESYSIIEGHTPKSVWLHLDGDVSIPEVLRLLKPFGNKPVIVKDFVKSQKHYWVEACFIPSVEDPVAVERVVRRFLELQGDSLAEGLVFREFVEFESLTTHSKSGMPLSKEFRIFFLDGNPLLVVRYWEQGDYAEDSPPLADFVAVAANVQSRFFTMDVAKRKDGQWEIVELGDGQVAGLPDNLNPNEFYELLQLRWPAA